MMAWRIVSFLVLVNSSGMAVMADALPSTAPHADEIVQKVDREEGDAGLIRLMKGYDPDLVQKSVARIIQKLAGLKTKVLSPQLEKLNSSEKRKLMGLILDQANEDNTWILVSALSKLSNVSDSQLFLSTYAGKAEGKRVAVLSMTRIAEEIDGEMGLFKLATRTDLSTEFSVSAISRLVEKLASPSAKGSALKSLSIGEKQTLIDKFLLSANEKNLAMVASSIAKLDRGGDIKEILNSFAGSSAGIVAASRALNSLEPSRLQSVK